MAGGPVSVQCSANPPDGDTGIAYWDTRKIVVDNYVCRNARDFARKPTLTSMDEVYTSFGSNVTTTRSYSLFVLAHEADHIKNPDHSEAQATCAGLRDVPRFARALGATRKASVRARNIARTWVRIEMPPEYQSACTR